MTGGGSVGSRPPTRHTAEVPLPPELSSPSLARRLVRDVLQAGDRLEWTDAAELAVSELVTNAALHAHTPMLVTVGLDDERLRVEVRDGNPLLPGRRDYDAHATTGRGMAVVGTLASEYGVVSLGDDGKIVWFEIDGRADEQSEEDLLSAWADSRWDLETVAPSSADRALRPVVLRSTPAALWLAARQHHDALLRELVLYLAEHDDVTVDLPLADQARGTVSAVVSAAVEESQRSGSARSVLPEGHPSPLPWVPPQLDLELNLPGEMGPAYAALQDALDAAERLAVAGRLLVRPGLPEIVAVRDWVCEQVQVQLAGVEPSAWGGADQSRFETDTHARADDQTWDLQAALSSGRGVVAADDANRIVGISDDLAARLGWEPAELVGRRVVALIPAHLREGHVAGFTRHLTTGEAHVLGVPLELPVLHADGSEVTCRFLIEQAAADGPRALYLAWIDPVEG